MSQTWDCSFKIGSIGPVDQQINLTSLYRSLSWTKLSVERLFNRWHLNSINSICLPIVDSVTSNLVSQWVGKDVIFKCHIMVESALNLVQLRWLLWKKYKGFTKCQSLFCFTVFGFWKKVVQCFRKTFFQRWVVTIWVIPLFKALTLPWPATSQLIIKNKAKGYNCYLTLQRN